MNGLSERAQQLIPKARIVSFAGWRDVDVDAIALLQAADDSKQYLTDADLAAFADIKPSTVRVIQQLRDQAADIVDEARGEVLQAFPGILEPGGGLHPAMRAEACWRDFWHFLRCITYGIAGEQTQYTSTEGLAAMEQLYQELQVPLPAMVEGLKGIKKASLSRFPAETHTALAPYFDHLTERLASFVK